MDGDEHYVQRCRNGSEEDFRALVRRYEKVLVAHLTAELRNRSWAEEAAQEAFVRAYFAIHRLREPKAFAGWLFGIADRVVMEQRRERAKQERLAINLPRREEVSEVDDDAVRQAVANLPGNYRQVVLMRYFGGFSCAEIGEKLSMPVGSVTKTLSRAYAMLRENLSDAEVPR